MDQASRRAGAGPDVAGTATACRDAPSTGIRAVGVGIVGIDLGVFGEFSVRAALAGNRC